MNLHGLIHSMQSVAQQAEARPVELRPGQVVSGVVLQMLAENEALLNINGATVRALLETPLQQGQRSLLQVQLDANGMLLLKPLHTPGAPAPAASLADLLHSLGARDTDANRQLLQLMHGSGIAVNGKSFAAFQSAAEARPSGMIPQQWMEAAIVAVKKGLPVKPDVLTAIREAVFGRPLPDLLTELSASLVRQAGEGARGAAPASPSTAALMGKLHDAIALLLRTAPPLDGEPAPVAAAPRSAQSAASGEAQRGAAAAPQPAAAGTLPAAPQGGGAAGQPAAPAAQAGQFAAQPGGQSAGANAAAAASPQAPPAGLDGAPSTAVRQEAGAPPATPQTAAQARSDAAMPPQTSAAAASAGVSGAPAAAGQAQAAAAAEQQQAPPPQSPQLQQQDNAAPRPEQQPWIKAVLKQLGVDHEQKVAQTLMQPAAASLEQTQEAQQSRFDSVKSLVMSLLAADDAPAALKEGLQQLLQHISGQQLMLGADRGNPFSLITLSIPIRLQDGMETASVHIQSRRGKNEQLDPANCRLLFDLHMKTLGNTLVDVQVTDKIVSLSIHNDHPAGQALLFAARPELETALEQMGYAFISLKHKPYPTTHNDIADATVQQQTNTIASPYKAKPYKGVDVRV